MYCRFRVAAGALIPEASPISLVDGETLASRGVGARLGTAMLTSRCAGPGSVPRKVLGEDLALPAPRAALGALLKDPAPRAALEVSSDSA